jgi:hypothetical protein
MSSSEVESPKTKEPNTFDCGFPNIRGPFWT